MNLLGVRRGYGDYDMSGVRNNPVSKTAVPNGWVPLIAVLSVTCRQSALFGRLGLVGGGDEYIERQNAR